jgi:hypothetical protein
VRIERFTETGRSERALYEDALDLIAREQRDLAALAAATPVDGGARSRVDRRHVTVRGEELRRQWETLVEIIERYNRRVRAEQRVAIP